MRFLGIGDNVVDVYVDRNVMYPGGNTLNFCAYAKKLGYDVGYIGVFGSDPPAKHVWSVAQSLGIDLSRCRQYTGENGCAKVNLTNGERIFVGSNKGGVSKEHSIHLDEEDLKYIKNFDLVHTSCFSYLEPELKKLNKIGIPVSYDFSTHLDPATLSEVCPHLFLAVGSCSHLSDNEIYALGKDMHRFGSQMALLSMGRRGAVLYDGVTFFHQDAGKEKAIDSMGAGDSFLTAFLTTYLSSRASSVSHEMAVRDALQKAANFATEICMVAGAFGYGTEYRS